MTTPATPLRRAYVVGAGLIGTSVALALRSRGVDTYLTDANAAAARLAADLGAGRDEPPTETVDLAVVAVPPSAVPGVLVDLQGKGIARAYTDVASTKGYVLRRAAEAGADLTTYVGGHPMAGRERSGPAAARADLFEGRPWVLTPSETTTPEVLAVTEALLSMCGAVPVRMSPAEHDSTVALVSHAPHVLASLIAARFADAAPDAVALAGQGVRDVTRIAASDPGLWREILATNSGAVASVLETIAADLLSVIDELTKLSDPREPLTATVQRLAQANVGQARLPGKHGMAPAEYATISVVLPDRPGQLARLFSDAGEAGINIEDVRIEHSPGQPVGLVELAVQPHVAGSLVEVLRRRGWSVH